MITYNSQFHKKRMLPKSKRNWSEAKSAGHRRNMVPHSLFNDCNRLTHGIGMPWDGPVQSKLLSQWPKL